MSEHGSSGSVCLAYSKYLDVNISGSKWSRITSGQEEAINDELGFFALNAKRTAM